MLGCLPREIATDEENWIFFFFFFWREGRGWRRAPEDGSGTACSSVRFLLPLGFFANERRNDGQTDCGPGPPPLPSGGSLQEAPPPSSFSLSSPPTPLCIAGGKGAKKIESSEQTAPAKISGLTRAGLGVYTEVEKLV